MPPPNSFPYFEDPSYLREAYSLVERPLFCATTTSMKEITFQRIHWMKWMFTLLDAYLIGTTIWLFYSLFHAKKAEPLLIAMAIMMAVFSLILFAVSLLSWLKKVNALILKEDRLIIRDYKEKTVMLSDVAAFRYQLNHASGAASRRIGQFKSGHIVITLKDKKAIWVKDQKNVAEVWEILDSKIRDN